MTLLDTFLESFMQCDKETCVTLSIEWLSTKKVSIRELYEDVITKAMDMAHQLSFDDHDMSIWREHARSAIARAIVECAYPYVLKEKVSLSSKSNIGKKVVVMCPEGELHELGARMATDFFTLAGYDAIFIGANTPRMDFVNSLTTINPVLVAISVTTQYNLVEAKKVISKIRAVSSNTQIWVGGQAFAKPELVVSLGVDGLITSLSSILNFEV